MLIQEYSVILRHIQNHLPYLAYLVIFIRIPVYSEPKYTKAYLKLKTNLPKFSHIESSAKLLK